MIIKKYGIQSAASSEGAVVVIDVLRAFTTAAYAFHRGVKEIFLVSTAEEAFLLKKKNNGFLIAGESGGKKIEGFDFGNSPEILDALDLTNSTLVLRSSSGTQGVVSAKKASKIFLGSLVVAKATMQALKDENLVTLLAMGSPNGPDKEEDLICADYMESLSTQTPLSWELVKKTVTDSPAGQQALDPTVDFKTPGDLKRAIDIDRFDFAMPVFREGEYLISRRTQR